MKEGNMEKRLVTAESVLMGHPDKVADRISDAILDEILRKDKEARVAIETLVTTGLVFVSGEVDTEAYCDIEKVVRDTVEEIGYTRGKFGFDAENLAVILSIHSQSPDIKRGVVKKDGSIGAGDQGVMFGYACDETENLMPLALELAQQLARRIDYLRNTKKLTYLRPDGKVQVTLEYDKKGKPLRAEGIVVSVQHREMDLKVLKKAIKEEVIEKVIPSYLIDQKTKIFINPTGRFVVGGPKADTGLTGRKIIVDTYGGFAHHGGGAFSGKDPSKVDRSASYMARYLAKNIVKSKLAKKCEVELAYIIGEEEPIGVNINTFNTALVAEELIIKTIKKHFSLTPKSIIERFNLRTPIYEKTSFYGHMGREDLKVGWEEVDSVTIFEKLLKSN
jgi:S-adenosylmethionine synthetase